MANRIPHHFLEAPKETINVSFTDTATGAGILELFFANTATENRLTQTSLYSHKPFIMSSTSTSGSYTQLMDKDFDLDFKKSATIEGEALFSLGLLCSNDEEYNDMKVYSDIIVKKWDGTTETTIATYTGSSNVINYETGSVQNIIFNNYTANLDLPKTTFKSGESLRITIHLYGQSNGTSDLQIAFCCDPKGRVSENENDKDLSWSAIGGAVSGTGLTGIFTNSTALIPFRV